MEGSDGVEENGVHLRIEHLDQKRDATTIVDDHQALPTREHANKQTYKPRENMQQEREKERDRERETERERKTERQRKRQRERETDRERQRERQTERQRQKERQSSSNLPIVGDVVEHARERLLYLGVGDGGQGLNGLSDHAGVANHRLQASFFLGELVHEFGGLRHHALVLVG